MKTSILASAGLLGSSLFLAACSSAEEVERELTTRDGAVSASSSSASASANGDGAVSIERETDDYIFEYAWPAPIGRHDTLRARFRQEIAASEKELQRAATEARSDAEANEYPFRQHAFDKQWEVVADLPDWLSLSATIYTFSGGAHGNTGYDSLVWDKSAGTAREPLDFFRSQGDLQRALGRRYCEALNGERAQRRGELIPADSEEMFERCPDLDELTVLLGSSTGEAFDRIGLIAGPYVAGPYAEGTYDITLPVTTPILDAVKPEYARLFALGPR